MIGSFGLIGIGCGWLWNLCQKYSFNLYSSSLISSAMTFFVLLVTSSFLMDHISSIISDPAFLFVYLVYNIWIILRDEATSSFSASLSSSPLMWPTDPWSFEFSAMFPIRYEITMGSLFDVVHSYTVEIILNLLFS